MANKYCNLIGSNLIKDEYQKINIGFTAVETDTDLLNTRIDNIIAESGTSPTEVIEARLSTRYGLFTTLKNRLDNTDEFVFRLKQHVFELSDYYIGDMISGSSDITTALEAAIAAAHAAGGGKITVPAGLWYVNNVDMGATAAGVTDVSIVGAGLGITEIRQLSGNQGYAIRMIDCMYCSIQDLTINSENVTDWGGIRMYSCQNSMFNNILVYKGNKSSIVISGADGGIGSILSYENTIKNCIVLDQRAWNLVDAKAMIDLSGNTKSTYVKNCKVFGNGFVGYLYKYFNNSYVIMDNCTGDGYASAALAVTFNRDVSINQCYLNSCNAGILATEIAVAHIANTKLEYLTDYTIKCTELTKLYTSNLTISSGTTQTLDTTAAVELQGACNISGIKFKNNNVGTTNILIYNNIAANLSENSVIITNCDFDRNLLVNGSGGASSIMVTNSKFSTTSIFKIINGGSHIIAQASNNVFCDKAFDISAVKYFKIFGNILRAIGGYANEAINISTVSANGIIESNTFVDYDTPVINTPAAPIVIHDNTFVNVTNPPPQV